MRRKPIFALTSHSDGRTARRVHEGPWLTPETKRFQAYFGIKEYPRVQRGITAWAETLCRKCAREDAGHADPRYVRIFATHHVVTLHYSFIILVALGSTIIFVNFHSFPDNVSSSKILLTTEIFTQFIKILCYFISLCLAFIFTLYSYARGIFTEILKITKSNNLLIIFVKINK